MDIKFQLQQAISLAVKKVTGLTILPQNITLEHPENEDFGDYSTNIAMKLFSETKLRSTIYDLRSKIKSPKDLAEKILLHLTSNILHLGSASVAEPGFINLSIKNECLIKEMQRVLSDGSNYGKLDQGKGKKIMVEFAHPNTHKAFHIGHLRNITTGEAIVRILEFNGYKVIRSNYQGDVGIHIAKCLYGILQTQISQPKAGRPRAEKLKSQNKLNLNFAKDWSLEKKAKYLGDTYVIGSNAYEDENNSQAQAEIKDINYLIYASAQKYQQEVHQIQPGSTDYMKFVHGKKYNLQMVYDVWVETRQWSLDYFENIYKRVSSHFDRYYFESQCLKGVDTAYEALKKGILKKSQGAIVFAGKPYNLDTRVFINSLGLPTYEGKELGLAPVELSEFGHLDKLIHVVTPEQTSFFQITFKVEELLGIQKDQQYHLVYNWVRLKKGKMSSRLGNVILGEWLLDEAKARIKKSFPKIDEKTAEMISVAAVKYSFLKPALNSEIAFDFEESINLQGNSGPYLQYTYARCKSVLAKAKTDDLRSKIYDLSINKEELAVLRTIYKFSEVIEQAGKNYSPNLICNYLYDLAQKYNTFYNKHRILTQNSKLTTEQTNFRLLLTSASAQIIKTGLNLLGIKCPEKM